MPRTFVAFFAGFAGISGFPPFGIFIGELFIIVGAFRAGHYVGVGIFILSLCVIFAGFANQVLKISFDDTDATIQLTEKRRHGLAPVYVAFDLAGVVLLDPGHPVPDHYPCGDFHRWRILMKTDFLEITNGEAISREQIPHLSFDAFHQEALNIVGNGGKVVHYFAYSDGSSVKLLAVLRTDTLLVAGCDAPEAYPSLTIQCEPFHMFEREIAEQFGIRPEGHPWLKMVRYHPNCRNVPDVFGNNYDEDIPGNYDYYAVEGEEIHEVAVGPVHAGVIEPGHFRFNCIGERVLNLEIQLGYQHRGIETLLTQVDAKRLPVLAESIAGDTTVGHSLCMAQAMEAFSSAKPDAGRTDHSNH